MSFDLPIDYVFLGWDHHIRNEMVPFFDALQKTEKVLFNCPPQNGGFQSAPRHPNAIIFASRWPDVIKSGLVQKYRRIRFVRIFHGIALPWAHAISNGAPWDVVIASSQIELEAWAKTGFQRRIEIVGWPKGEEVIHQRSNLTNPNPNKVLIGSSWAKEKSGFKFYTELMDLDHYDRTWMLHPLLVNPEVPLSPRAHSPEFGKSLIQDCKRKGINIHFGNSNVTRIMHDQAILVGAKSSTSFEWILFDRPTLFMVSHPDLNFGKCLIGHENSISKCIEKALDREEDCFVDARKVWNDKLTSHLDGKWKERFLEVVQDIEQELLEK